jgi:hypothetical protein
LDTENEKGNKKETKKNQQEEEEERTTFWKLDILKYNLTICFKALNPLQKKRKEKKKDV